MCKFLPIYCPQKGQIVHSHPRVLCNFTETLMFFVVDREGRVHHQRIADGKECRKNALRRMEAKRERLK